MNRRLVLVPFLICLIVKPVMPAESAPETKRVPVTDTYHGVTVVDPYRWLESGDDESVRQWSRDQNAHARRYLDTLPQVEALRRGVTEILSDSSVSYGGVAVVGEKVFAIKRQPPKQQPFLIVCSDLKTPDNARVLVDPNAIDTDGTTKIDWYVPSPDGRMIAVSLSSKGTESGDVHVFDTQSGEKVGAVVPRVNGGTAGGDLAWTPDGKGFYYTRYPRGDERPAEDRDFYQQVYFHQLGSATEDDRYELGEGLPRIAEIQLDCHSETGDVLATVQDGDGGEFAHFLRSSDGRWRQFSTFGDRVVQAVFGGDGRLFLVSRHEAPRGKILSISTGDLTMDKAKTVVPEGEDTIVSSFWGAPSVLFTGSRLFVTYQLGGPSEVRVFTADGKQLDSPPQQPISSIGGLQAIGEQDVLYRSESFVAPGGYHCYRVELGQSEKTGFVNDTPIDMSDITVRREFARSKDGTLVPLTILLPPGTGPDGKHPCIATGYGGYGISIQPRFRSLDDLYLKQGVIRVIANLRGGGEYGEAWHLGGNLTNKQNVFDDFAAVLQHLIDRGYTTPRQLGIIGGSNGGLLMGATLTQHPELMRAVVSRVGIYDMLRVEESPNGAFNIPEFGTVEDPVQFEALHAYSPYHAVRDGVKYPPILFTTGENDPRVDPMQSRKMTARLQAASDQDSRILLRTNANTGHGADASLRDRIDEEVDIAAFLFTQLGVDYRDR